MSEIKVNKISPRTACGTTTLGDSGDTFTIPSGVTISNLGTAAGFGGTGEISWDTTVKTNSDSGFTATSGIGYFLNTTGGTITVNLPAGVAGSSVAFADYAGTWQTSAVTVSPNGSDKMGGVASAITLSTEGQSVQFVYIDGVQGWINVLDSTSNVRGAEFMAASGGCITTCGNDKIHKFNSPGTFTVCTVAGCASRNVVSYLVVAGGGGSPSAEGAGGGAGGFREVKTPLNPYSASPLDGYGTPGNRVTVSVTSYPITVGGGGAGGTPYPGQNAGTQGDSSIFDTITAAGGGRGGQSYSAAQPQFPAGGNIGGPGGSGGGGGYACTGNPSPSSTTNPNTQGGTGNTPPVTPSQGNNGGAGQTGFYGNQGAGGGAGAVGGTASGPSPAPGGAGGNGGVGVSTEISGAAVTRGGGGGGSAYAGATAGTGGTGGGGAGRNSSGTGTAGTANTGGGGGGSKSAVGATGGSGIVIIRYKYQ